MRRSPFFVWLALLAGLALAPFTVGGSPQTSGRAAIDRLFHHDVPLPRASEAARLGLLSIARAERGHDPGGSGPALLTARRTTPAWALVSPLPALTSCRASLSPLPVLPYFPTGPPVRG